MRSDALYCSTTCRSHGNRRSQASVAHLLPEPFNRWRFEVETGRVWQDGPLRLMKQDDCLTAGVVEKGETHFCGGVYRDGERLLLAAKQQHAALFVAWLAQYGVMADPATLTPCETPEHLGLRYVAKLKPHTYQAVIMGREVTTHMTAAEREQQWREFGNKNSSRATLKTGPPQVDRRRLGWRPRRGRPDEGVQHGVSAR